MNGKKFISFLIVFSLFLSLSPLITHSASKDSTLDWPQFLGGGEMPGVSDAKTPTSGDNLKEIWKKNYGSGWTATPGTPIVVDDFVYCYIDQKIRKFDLYSGEEVASSAVFGKAVNQFFIYSAYGDGKIFVPCQENSLDLEETGVKGCHIRVYDADTLEQLYITESIGSVSMQTPITYHDGFIFTGAYSTGRYYACFDTKDDDPNKNNEVKEAKWKIESVGTMGFKWNGAAFVRDSCIFADAGGLPARESSSFIYVVDYRTGDIKQTLELPKGYIAQTSVVYYEKNNRVYISSNSPSSCAAILSYEINEDGTIDIGSELEYQSGISWGGTQSTPVIYNDRIYLGGGGGTMGSNEPFHVIDANTLEEIYTVDGLITKGSAAISTAYATKENNNMVYIYVVPYSYDTRNKISHLWILKDREGQTEPDYEIVSGVGLPQFCSQTIAIAKNGSLIWYNDAKYLYCYGNREDTAIKAEDVDRQIHRLPKLEDFGYYNEFELRRIEERYLALSQEEKAKVKSYDELKAIMEVASIDPFTRLNQGIESLPGLDQLILSEHRFKVESMFAAYGNLDDEERKRIHDPDKLMDAYGRILYLIEQEAVDSVITKIGQLPEVDAITIAHRAAVESVLASFRNLDEDLRARVTNEDKLKACLERIEAILSQLDEAKDFILKRLADATITLESREIIDELDEMMSGLSLTDILAINEYEQYVSPAKVDLINLMIGEHLIAEGKGIPVTEENAKELDSLIGAIQSYYDGVLEGDRRYIENYDILLAIKNDIEGFKNPVKPEPPKEEEDKPGEKGDEAGKDKEQPHENKADETKDDGGKTPPTKIVSPPPAKKAPIKVANNPPKASQYIRVSTGNQGDGGEAGAIDDENLEDEDEDGSIEDDETLEDEDQEEENEETEQLGDQPGDESEDIGSTEDEDGLEAAAMDKKAVPKKNNRTLPIVILSLVAVLGGIAVLLLKIKKTI